MLRPFLCWLIGMFLRFLLFLVVKLPKKDRVVGTVIGDNRTRLAKILNFLFPSASTVFPEKLESLPFRFERSGIVLGFNHFSLGEIPRLIALCFKSYQNRDLLFPINDEFYPIFSYSKKYLDAVGIELCPLITPRVYKKLMEFYQDVPDAKREVEARRAKLDREYLNRAAVVLEENGVVLVAPSATRRPTVFGSEEEFLGLKPVPPVFRLLALNFSRLFPNRHHLEFIPVPITPPASFSRGLNLFRKYYFPAFFTPFGLEEAKQKEFDHDFLMFIADQLPRSLSYPS